MTAMLRFFVPLGCGLLAGALLAPPAFSHELDTPISAKRLMINSVRGPAKQKVRFITRGEDFALGLGHDPRSVPTWLLIRGEGANAGSSGRIDLDPSKWSALGKKTPPRGYKYFDKEAESGGIKKIILKSGQVVS